MNTIIQTNSQYPSLSYSSLITSLQDLFSVVALQITTVVLFGDTLSKYSSLHYLSPQSHTEKLLSPSEYSAYLRKNSSSHLEKCPSSAYSHTINGHCFLLLVLSSSESIVSSSQVLQSLTP